jgi:hypothetical protein
MYEIGRNSTMRLVKDELDALGGTQQYYDWDAHAETFKLPDVDLVGLVGFSMTQEDKFHDLVCGIGIITQSDNGLYRLTSLVDHFYNRLAAGGRFAVYDSNGDQCGIATCFDGTTVSPATQVDTRPAQTITFSARIVPEGI